MMKSTVARNQPKTYNETEFERAGYALRTGTRQAVFKIQVVGKIPTDCKHCVDVTHVHGQSLEDINTLQIAAGDPLIKGVPVDGTTTIVIVEDGPTNQRYLHHHTVFTIVPRSYFETTVGAATLILFRKWRKEAKEWIRNFLEAQEKKPGFFTTREAKVNVETKLNLLFPALAGNTLEELLTAFLYVCTVYKKPIHDLLKLDPTDHGLINSRYGPTTCMNPKQKALYYTYADLSIELTWWAECIVDVDIQLRIGSHPDVSYKNKEIPGAALDWDDQGHQTEEKKCPQTGKYICREVITMDPKKFTGCFGYVSLLRFSGAKATVYWKLSITGPGVRSIVTEGIVPADAPNGGSNPKNAFHRQKINISELVAKDVRSLDIPTKQTPFTFHDTGTKPCQKTIPPGTNMHTWMVTPGLKRDLTRFPVGNGIQTQRTTGVQAAVLETTIYGVTYLGFKSSKEEHKPNVNIKTYMLPQGDLNNELRSVNLTSTEKPIIWCREFKSEEDDRDNGDVNPIEDVNVMVLVLPPAYLDVITREDAPPSYDEAVIPLSCGDVLPPPYHA
jgi:hypothetical protein